jgi:hypothetical protein
VDPNAELTVGEGEVRVTISRFSLSHDTFQSADKYLAFSTRRFELPPDRAATFGADLADRNIGRRTSGGEWPPSTSPSSTEQARVRSVRHLDPRIRASGSSTSRGSTPSAGPPVSNSAGRRRPPLAVPSSSGARVRALSAGDFEATVVCGSGSCKEVRAGACTSTSRANR